MVVHNGIVHRVAIIAHSRVSIGAFCDKECGHVREASQQLMEFEKEDLHEKFSLCDVEEGSWTMTAAGKLKGESLDGVTAGNNEEQVSDAEDVAEKKEEATEEDSDGDDDDDDCKDEDDDDDDDKDEPEGMGIQDSGVNVTGKRKAGEAGLDAPETQDFEKEHASHRTRLEQHPQIKACLHCPPFMDPSGYVSIFIDQILLLREKHSWIEEDELVQLLLIVLHSNGTPLFKFITDLWLCDPGWKLEKNFVGSLPNSPEKMNLWKQHCLDLRVLGFAAFSSMPQKHARCTASMNTKIPSDRLEQSLSNLKVIIGLAEDGTSFNEVIDLLSKKCKDGGVHCVSVLTALPFCSVATGIGLLTSQAALINSMGAVMTEKNPSLKALTNFKPERTFDTEEPELEALMAVKFGFNDNKDNRAMLLKRLGEWLGRPIFHIENGLCEKHRKDKKYDIFCEKQSLHRRCVCDDGNVRLHRKKWDEITWSEHTPQHRSDDWMVGVRAMIAEGEKRKSSGTGEN